MSLPASTIAWFLFSVVAQLGAITLLPRTAGFTKAAPTLLCAGLFLLGIYALARLTHKGVDLGLLVPAMSGFIPLVTIAIGIFVYGESASPLKLGLLVGACVLIGVAAARG